MSAQISYFAETTLFLNIWELKYLERKQWVNEKHFQFWTQFLFVKQNKISNWPRPSFKTVSAQKHYFTKGSIFKPLSPETFAKKISQSIKTIFYLSYHKSMLKKWNFKTDCTHFSKLCLDERVVLFIKQIFWILENLNVCKGSQRVKKKHFISQL